MRDPKPRSRRPRRPAPPRESAALPLLLGAGEAAALLGWSRMTLHRRIPELPAPIVMAGTSVRQWSRASLERWVEARQAAAEIARQEAGGAG